MKICKYIFFGNTRNSEKNPPIINSNNLSPSPRLKSVTRPSQVHGFSKQQR